MAASSEIAAESANQALQQIYSAPLEEWKTHHERLKPQVLSIPFFLKATSAYFESPVKVLFCGQETHGWLTDCAMPTERITSEWIMGRHIEVMAWIHAKRTRPAYSQAVKRVAGGLGLYQTPDSYLFSNIFPCDVDKKQAPLELHETFRRWAILPQQVEILKPDWIIFFCGSYYGNLHAFFGELPGRPTIKQPLVEYRPKRHQWRGLVTYHPAYLRRYKLWSVLDCIVDKIKP